MPFSHTFTNSASLLLKGRRNLTCTEACRQLLAFRETDLKSVVDPYADSMAQTWIMRPTHRGLHPCATSAGLCIRCSSAASEKVHRRRNPQLLLLGIKGVSYTTIWRYINQLA